MSNTHSENENMGLTHVEFGLGPVLWSQISQDYANLTENLRSLCDQKPVKSLIKKVTIDLYDLVFTKASRGRGGKRRRRGNRLNYDFDTRPSKCIKALLNEAIDQTSVKQNRRKYLKVETVKDFYEGLYGDSSRIRLTREDEVTPTCVISCEQVRAACSKIKKTAAGLDRISYSEVKQAARDEMKLALLTVLFNVWFKFGIPAHVKCARVALLPKGKVQRGIGDYRPVSVTSVVYRTFSRIIFGTLDAQIGDKLHEAQKGFRSGINGLGLNVTALYSAMMHKNTNFESWAMASVDVKKAFDSVSHRAVVTALESLGATSQVINTIKSVLSEVFMYFNVSGRTIRVKMERGVPQGNPLSGLLFNAAIDPIVRAIANTAPLQVGNERIGALCFADDLVLLAENRASIIDKLNITIRRFGEIGLKINFGKSSAIVATPGRRKLNFNHVPLEVEGGSINCLKRCDSEAFKFLGIEFQSSFKLRKSKRQIKCDLARDLERVRRSRLSIKRKILAIKRHVFPRYIYRLILLPVKSFWSRTGGKNRCRLLEECDKLVTNSIAKVLDYETRVGTSRVFNCPMKAGGFGIPLYSLVVRKAKSQLLSHVRQHSPLKHLVEQVFFVDRERDESDLARVLGPNYAIVMRETETVRGQLVKRVSTTLETGATRPIGKTALIGGGPVIISNTFRAQNLTGRRFVRAWKLRLNALPTAANLFRWGQKTSPLCQACRSGKRENIEHILNDRSCQTARLERFWIESHDYMRDRLFNYLSKRAKGTIVLCHELDCRTAKPDLVVVERVKRQVVVVDYCITWETKNGKWVLGERERSKVSKYEAEGPRNAILSALEGKLGIDCAGFAYQVKCLCLGRRGSYSEATASNFRSLSKLISAANEAGQWRDCRYLDLLATDILSKTAGYVAQVVGDGLNTSGQFERITRGRDPTRVRRNDTPLHLDRQARGRCKRTREGERVLRSSRKRTREGVHIRFQ